MKILTLLLLLLLPLQGYTAALSISPTRLVLDPKTKVATLTLENKSDTPTNVQIKANGWYMDDAGNYIEDKTGDFLFFPRLATIAAGQTQVIRVGYQGDFPSMEKSYRVYVQELPPVKQPDYLKPEGNTVAGGVQILLGMSIAVYIRPSADKIPPPQIKWISAEKVKGNIKIGLENQGSFHFYTQRVELDLQDKAGNSLFSKEFQSYQSFHGRKHGYTVLPTKLEEAVCLKARKGKVTIFLENQEEPYKTDFELSGKDDCK